MKFIGISKTFSTINEEQYNTIGLFWDELSKIYGKDNLRGLGYNWKNGTSIEYVIGLKEGIIDNYNIIVDLPDNGWKIVSGKLDNLGKIYEDIYKDGNLLYEIEMFDELGNCEIKYYR